MKPKSLKKFKDDPKANPNQPEDEEEDLPCPQEGSDYEVEKKKTFAQMFNEIEKEEQVVDIDSDDCGDSSAGNASDRSKKEADAYGSDDEQNN